MADAKPNHHSFYSVKRGVARFRIGRALRRRPGLPLGAAGLSRLSHAAFFFATGRAVF
jgi:hypothetical protein